MNKQRAQQIAESPVMANVSHEGKQIYIQNVDHERETARIYPLGQRENELVVPLNQLIEQ